MKQRLLGNSIGRLALSLRNKIDIIRTAFFHPEKIGDEANNQLATKLVTTICQSNKTFIDVGAHIGSIISEVIYANSSVKIVAIEAIPEKSKKLRRKFPFVKLYNCAVGDFTGEIPFFVNIKQSGYSSLIKPANLKQDEMIEINVPIKRLDDIVSLNEIHDVDVIKIDVEGAELGVLLGSVNTLNKNRPIIMFESGPSSSNNFAYTKEELYQFFSSHNYAVLIPNRLAHNDHGLSEEGFIESHLYPRRTTNYFAIPNERRIEIRDRSRKILGISTF